MTKSELIEPLAEQHAHVPVKEVEYAVKEILEQMAGSLSTSERIEI
ncbi:HU family DNA-binding protein, partial [Pseudoalteromonas agarivorans]